MSKKNVEWEWKKLGDVCDFNRGLTYAKKDEVEFSSNCILRSNNVDLETNALNLDELKYIRKDFDIPTSKYVKQGCLLICMSNGSKSHLGKVAYIDQDYNFAFGGFMGLLCPNNSVNGKFLHLMMCSPAYKGYIKSLSDGANINNLKYDDLKEFDIPIPPLDEQERIVKVLDDAFEKIDAIKTTAETNLQNAKDLFQTTLANEFVVSKENNLWTIHNLEDIVSEDCSISYGIVQPGEHIEDGIPVVRPIDLKEKNLDSVDSLKRTSKKISDAYKRTILQGGEILMCVRGTTGTVSIASDDFKNCNVTRGIVPFRFGTKTFTSFMYYAFVSSFVSNQIQEQTRGTALKQINIKDLKEIKIPLPPLSIQKQIVAKLDSLSEKVKQLESNYKQVLADCDELKKAILKQAFEGML